MIHSIQWIPVTIREEINFKKYQILQEQIKLHEKTVKL